MYHVCVYTEFLHTHTRLSRCIDFAMLNVVVGSCLACVVCCHRGRYDINKAMYDFDLVNNLLVLSFNFNFDNDGYTRRLCIQKPYSCVDTRQPVLVVTSG